MNEETKAVVVYFPAIWVVLLMATCAMLTLVLPFFVYGNQVFDWNLWLTFLRTARVLDYIGLLAYFIFCPVLLFSFFYSFSSPRKIEFDHEGICLVRLNNKEERTPWREVEFASMKPTSRIMMEISLTLLNKRKKKYLFLRGKEDAVNRINALYLRSRNYRDNFT